MANATASRKEERRADRVVTSNRRAFHEYFIDDTIEAGIVLQGTEIKSIRDGKVSSETLRDLRPRADGDPAEHSPAFTELTVLDSAGRMQIPKDLRTQLGLQRYVRLEVVEGGILIRPAEDHPGHQHDTKSVFSEVEAAPEETRFQQFLRRWLPKRGDGA